MTPRFWWDGRILDEVCCQRRTGIPINERQSTWYRVPQIKLELHCWNALEVPSLSSSAQCVCDESVCAQCVICKMKKR